MDKKQLKIFERLLKKFDIPKEHTFIQHRNLTEFRSFDIEKINPTHKLILYGKLRKKFIKDGCSIKIIRVGEIILCSAFIIYSCNNQIAYYLANVIGYLYLSWLFLNLSFGDLDINVNRNRGRTWKWKNSIKSVLS